MLMSTSIERLITNSKIMSLNKFGMRSLEEIKSERHKNSWKEEVDSSVGRSSRELGIFNRQEIEKNIKQLLENILRMNEFKFIQLLRDISPDIGVYVVGGSVRDAVLKKSAKDIDLIINKINPIELIDILLKNGRVTFDRNPKAQLDAMTPEEKNRLIKESYGVIKFMPENSSLSEPIDIAFPREDDYSKSGQSGISGIKRDTDSKADPNLDINYDLERRDLTINAMAVNLVNGEIIDPFEGIEDIIKGKIRSVGNPEDRILKEDLSRGFRAIRFGCVFSSDIDTRTKKAIREIFKPASQSPEVIYQNNPNILHQIKIYEKEVRDHFKIPNGPLPKCLQVFWDREQQKPRMAVAKEVMSKEILKSIDANPKQFINLMDEIGGLEIILPELTHLKNLRQPKEFHSEGDAFHHTMMLLDHLPEKASLRLKLAALFHDLGKAETQKISESGKITFHGHDKKSVEIIQQIASRFRMPAKLTEEVSWLVQNHMIPLSSNINQMKSTTLEKIFLLDENLGNDLMILSKADALSSLSEKGKPDLGDIEILSERIEQVKRSVKSKEINRIVTGSDLISLGFKPGPEFSDIMQKIRELQLNGKIKTKEDALQFVRKIGNK